MWKARLDSLTRLLGEEGNPLHSPDVSSTRLRGGPDTTLLVTSKNHIYRTKGNPPDSKTVSSYTTFRPISTFYLELEAWLKATAFAKEPGYSDPTLHTTKPGGGSQKTVLRIRDVYPGSRILIFTHPRSRIPDPKTATKVRGEKKFFVILFYVATNFTKLIIILVLKCWRNKFGPIFKEL